MLLQQEDCRYVLVARGIRTLSYFCTFTPRTSLEDALAKQHVQGAAGNFFRHDKTTIVKVVMFCSGSSSDFSAKTNQSAFRVFLAGSDK